MLGLALEPWASKALFAPYPGADPGGDATIVGGDVASALALAPFLTPAALVLAVRALRWLPGGRRPTRHRGGRAAATSPAR